MAAVVALFVAIPTLAFAEVDQYVVGVNGMACPFCAYGIEKKLKDIDGVDELNIRIKDGEVDVPVENTVTPDQIQTAIKKAGFELRDLVVRGTGQIKADGSPRIEFSDGLSLPLVGYKGEAGHFKVSGSVIRKGDRWVFEVTEKEAV
jgi:mercuric ion binding protein